MKKSKGKGKKSKKSTKTAGKKDPNEKKSIYDIPDYIDPIEFTPKVVLNIRLASPLSDIHNFTLEDVPITTRLEEIKRKIVDRHHGAIDNVTICLNRYDANEAVDLSKRLWDVGITTAGECRVFYEYIPISYPLLSN